MSMCLGDDSPYPELVQSPRPRRRRASGEDASCSSPVSPRRPYRSSFSPVADVGSGERGGGGGLHGGGAGARRGGAQNVFEAKKSVREVRMVLSHIRFAGERVPCTGRC